MRSTIKKHFAVLPFLALSALSVAPGYSFAADAGLTDIQKSEVRQVIKEYLRENPELVVEALQSFQQKQQEESLNAAKAKINKYKSQLTAKDLPGAGNPAGDVTVIEFFDYNCGYCKKAIGDIQHALEKDKNVRFVFFDMPILGPSSIEAAKWAHAAHVQGKYFEFHTALMEHKGGLEEDVLADLAKKVGLDVEKAKKDAADPALEANLQKGIEMGHDIGVNGTPGFIIGDQLYPGYLGEEGLMKAITDARAAAPAKK